MRIAVAALLLALATVQAAGCARKSKTPLANGAEPYPDGVVSVQNDNWLDVVVYAVNGSTKFRLGAVNGISSGTFRLTSSLSPTGSVRLLVDPIGAPKGYMTDAITIAPGQRIELRVGSPLNMSTVAVWNR
jgi:hypothetical protein